MGDAQAPVMSPGAEALRHRLDQRRQAGLYRHRRQLQSPQGTEVVVGGRPLLSFCSNDYLGLCNHPRLVQALCEAAGQAGAGSGASHLVSGHHRIHHELEEQLAAFCRRPRAVLFSSGYLANLGVMTALLKPGDQVFEDRLNHASLLDGGLLSRARLHRFAHGDVADLTARLERCPEGGLRLIAVDGVFSMDGDLAPLPELAAVAARHDAWLMVDEAHALGCLGPDGRGLTASHGLDETQVPILMGTLGKALGGMGAFVAGSELLVESLIQFARSYIYTTALPPAMAAVAGAALKVLSEEGWRRERLAERIDYFRSRAGRLGLPLGSSTTAIQPLLLGDAAAAVRLSGELEKAGILVPAIRPPTVLAGTARLRISLSAAHTEQQLDFLLQALERAWN